MQVVDEDTITLSLIHNYILIKLSMLTKLKILIMLTYLTLQWKCLFIDLIDVQFKEVKSHDNDHILT